MINYDRALVLKSGGPEFKTSAFRWIYSRSLHPIKCIFRQRPSRRNILRHPFLENVRVKNQLKAIFWQNARS